MWGRGRKFGKTRTDGRVYQGDTLKHTFTKKHHNVSSGASPKAGNEVQQQMSAFVGWPGVVRWRNKRAENLNYRKRSKVVVFFTDFLESVSNVVCRSFYFFFPPKRIRKSSDWWLIRLFIKKAHQTGLHPVVNQRLLLRGQYSNDYSLLIITHEIHETSHFHFWANILTLK